ncbi:MAG: choice-of-anchor L domain-containing protein [Bacteroidia bacterium]|nr:choice-of-anchor L domain-containing protein [Bacteroidia bacterium]
MKKFYIIFILVVIPALFSSAQYLKRSDFQPRNIPSVVHYKNIQSGPVMVDTLLSIQQAISTLFGPGVTVSNLTFTGTSHSIGSFIDTTTVLLDSAADFGIDTGIIISTGSVLDAPGPNDSQSTSTNLGLPGDADLNLLLTGYTTFDASAIEFDFTPQTDTLIACEFIFASEEYPEWVNSSFNDVFAFFISGPGFNGLQNLAVLDSAVTPSGTEYNCPISVNTVNDLTNNNLFVLNNWDIVEYDGYTVPIQLMHPITPGQTYHFKIAIADGGDAMFDASVFLKAGSFLGYASIPVSGFLFAYVPNSLDISFTNTTNYATSYDWDFGDGATSHEISPVHEFTAAGVYTVKMTAHNYYQSNITERQITVSDIQSINNTDNHVISLVPVSEGVWQLHNLKNNDYAVINVYSLSGELIYSSANVRNDGIIDLSGFSKGLYSILLITNEHNSYFKVVN